MGAAVFGLVAGAYEVSGLDLLEDADLAVRQGPPATRWRNWWWAETEIKFSNGVFGPGRIVAPAVHPSEDVARTYAQWLIDRNRGLINDGVLVYLGAEPEA